MRVTKKTLAILTERLNKVNAELLEKTEYKEIVLTHNNTYDYPYRLELIYKEGSAVSNLGDRMSGREMYYYLKGLFQYPSLFNLF